MELVWLAKAVVVREDVFAAGARLILAVEKAWPVRYSVKLISILFFMRNQLRYGWAVIEHTDDSRYKHTVGTSSCMLITKICLYREAILQ